MIAKNMKQPPQPEDDEQQGAAPTTPDAQGDGDGDGKDGPTPGAVDPKADPSDSDADGDSGSDDDSDGDGGDASGGDSPNVTPQEQQQYDLVVVAALGIVYAKGAPQMIVSKLKSFAQQGPDGIASGIGNTTAMVLISVKTAFQKQGRAIPPDVMFGAGKEVVAAILEIAATAGLCKANDPDVLKKAAFSAVHDYGTWELKTGQLGPQERAQAQQSMSQIRGQPGGDAAPTGLVGSNMGPSQQQGAPQ